MNYEVALQKIEHLSEGFAIPRACQIAQEIQDSAEIGITQKYNLLHTLFQKAIEQGERRGEIRMRNKALESIKNITQ